MMKKFRLANFPYFPLSAFGRELVAETRVA